MTLVLDGKKVASELRAKLEKNVKNLNSQKIFPTLCVIEVGEDPASQIYLRLKRKVAHQLGIKEITLRFPAEISQAELIAAIQEKNADAQVNAIMVQLPLPKHIDEEAIIQSIDPAKDVDGFHPLNQGKMWQGPSDIIPATVRGILSLLDYYQLDVAGKNALVIGRSVIVGKPIACQLLNRDATVTIAHSRTKNLADLTQQADLIISDVGKAHLIKPDMLKKDSIVIDVGMNREHGKLMGDVDYDDCFAKTSAITPVPGGVGPLTVANLMKQVIILTEKQNNGR